jgi:hypothetical protein
MTGSWGEAGFSGQAPDSLNPTADLSGAYVRRGKKPFCIHQSILLPKNNSDHCVTA